MSKLKVGQKLYGVLGEAEIIRVDFNDKKQCYRIDYNDINGDNNKRWITDDLKMVYHNVFSSMFTFEDCPDIYRPKVLEYKVLYFSKLQDCTKISIDTYRNEEHFKDENPNLIFIKSIK